MDVRGGFHNAADCRIGDIDFITKIPGLVNSQFVLLKIANSLRGISLGYLVLNALFPGQRIS